MVKLAPKPFFVLHVIWHPAFTKGRKLAEVLFNHYQGDWTNRIGAGIGVPVRHHRGPAGTPTVPSSIDLDESETAAIVVLVDDIFAADPEWVELFQGLSKKANKKKYSHIVFPVVFSDEAMHKLQTSTQAIRWSEWRKDKKSEKRAKLLAHLTYQFSRMLRTYLETLKHPAADDQMLESYLEKVRVFLSHSKHDPIGENLALAVRKYIQDDLGMASFFDAIEIAPGLQFDEVLSHCVRRSAILALHTDSYSTREWCRREILEAKLYGKPIVVANCLVDREERGFPYLGNVPVVRMDPSENKRIVHVISRLLDEVFKDFIWECQTLSHRTKKSKVEFISSQPELLTLTRYTEAGADGKFRAVPKTIVYPDPPLSKEEELLFEKLVPGTDLKSFQQWQSSLLATGGA